MLPICVNNERREEPFFFPLGRNHHEKLNQIKGSHDCNSKIVDHNILCGDINPIVIIMLLVATKAQKSNR